jgi:hypothetical protein
MMNYLNFNLIVVILINIFLFTPNPLYSGDSTATKMKGRVYGLIYTNVYSSINSKEKASAFEMKRIYLGYGKALGESFEANIKIDIGSPDDLSPFSLTRRYAYFKNAYVRYYQGNISVLFGIIDLQQFKLQEKIWAHRYIEKAFADLYRLGSSSDLGAQVNYQWNESLSSDFTMMNSQGLTQVQSHSNYKYGFGITVIPINKLIARTYYDLTYQEIFQSTFTFFVGYHDEKKWSTGIEYNHRFNNSFVEEHQRFGYSGYVTWYFYEKWQAFGRYDKIISNKLFNEPNPWNLQNDGSKIIAGIEYTPVNALKIALNYQDWFPYAVNEQNQQFIFLNLEISL